MDFATPVSNLSPSKNGDSSSLLNEFIPNPNYISTPPLYKKKQIK